MLTMAVGLALAVSVTGLVLEWSDRGLYAAGLGVVVVVSVIGALTMPQPRR